MDSGGNDGWRRAPQDPEGDPRAYQGYGGGATSANGGSKYGAYDAHQHQHQHQEGNANDSYQGQTHYDNAGTHEGGYYQGYPQDTGYSNRGFQTQDVSDGRNYPAGAMDLLALASTRATPQDVSTQVEAVCVQIDTTAAEQNGGGQAEGGETGEKERIEADRLEQERLATVEEAARQEEEQEKERRAKEEAQERERLAAEQRAKEEKERIEAERIEQERLAAAEQAARLEAEERLEKERLAAAEEAARIEEAEKAARLDAERKERERVEAEARKAEEERLEKERLAAAEEAARVEEAEKAARLEAERKERERIEAEAATRKAEKEQLEKERLSAADMSEPAVVDAVKEAFPVDERAVEVSIKAETPVRGELTNEAANALAQAIGTGIPPDTPEGGAEVTAMDSEPIDDTFVDGSNQVVVAIQPNTPVGAQTASEPPLKEAAASSTAALQDDVNKRLPAQATAKDEGVVKVESSAEKPPAAEGENLPSPTQLPPSGLVSLRGKLESSGGMHKIHGIWALALDTILSDPENTKGLCLDFEYELHPSGGEAGNDVPPSGKYSGWFELNADDGLSKLKTPETDIELRFIKNSEGYHNVEGAGSNIYGSYSILGTLSADGVITMCRKFVTPKSKPKPKRTKKAASRRSKASHSGKRKRGSSKSDTAPKKLMGVPRHKDSGKRYGVGKPGLLCDVCFFPEDGEIAQTPLIKCIHCGLVAHSACYPPASSVDAKGSFLCDACTAFFHPSVNKAARTKNPSDGNIPQPKPLASDIEAKDDGRLHGSGLFCQLCARSDVLGGMKPTDSNSWVHLACLMSADSAFFDDATAVGVQGALKKNRTELIKRKKASGAKPKCEECGGDSGMLLKCREDGCNRYLHALCAEILDRLRVVENNGARDVISYKCTLHSYGGLDACGICSQSDRQSEMLECDNCQQGYHMSCLSPPLTEIPEDDWFCAKCS
ncbi:hypothetical protein ACHAXT_008075 [Thalassiosira profunda]